MSGFHYEKGLLHQELAVEAVLQALDGATIENIKDSNGLKIDDLALRKNIRAIQQNNGINNVQPSNKRVLDISMETGTGKTYTYTKTMYDLHRLYGVFKFIVVVPTLSIKAGTENFLKSTALAEHFRLDFEGMYGNTEIELYTVQSQKAKGKSKKSPAITTINQFVSTTDKNKIHVLLINAGMINSDTLAGTDSGNDGSTLFKDEFAKPFEAIASVKPFVIIDEPHKFAQGNKTWENIQKFKPAFIIRYGATFNNQYENLLYRLTAVDAFNDNLVKGVNVFVQEIEGDDGTMVQLVESSKDKAVFKRIEKNDTQSITLQKKESLATVHPMMTDLFVEAISSKNNLVVLSNGLELKKGDKLNPYSYDATVADNMLRQAIKTHFDLEKQLLTRQNGRLKPLTLFFIDNIASYRDGKNDPDSLLNRFEAIVKNEAKKRLEKESDEFYRTYLEKTVSDISATHGGYFSKDNSDNDEKIEKEVQEILHDKESLLSLDNPRRFIFSKWTLREGWDNPNVFGICKLRSSGSETSKLQEVGRGLRLPVNEYMARVKDENFYLNYFVDSSERDFVSKLIGEVNSSVNTQTLPDQLTDEIIEKIFEVYEKTGETKRSIRRKIEDAQIVDDNYKFTDESSFAKLKELYPLVFSSSHLKENKIRNNSEKAKQTVSMRNGQYAELKTLWEAINQKVILHYDIDKEKDFLNLFIQYLKDNQAAFKVSGIRTTQIQIRTYRNMLTATHQESIEEANFEPIPMMDYKEFLIKLSQATFIKRTTLHQAFQTVKGRIDIELFLNQQTINGLKSGFNRWLLLNSLTKFDIGYTKMSVNVHPTKFTNEKGEALSEILASDLGTQNDENEKPLPQYLFNKVFFDSELEKQNITQNEIKEVVVFTKIPKNSIKIPVAGGGTYSPDFAYIIKTEKGDILNLILETKNVTDTDSLRKEEEQKIKHAEKMFEVIGQDIKVVFKTQFSGHTVKDMISNILSR